MEVSDSVDGSEEQIVAILPDCLEDKCTKQREKLLEKDSIKIANVINFSLVHLFVSSN